MTTERLIGMSVERAVEWHSDCPDAYFLGNSIVGASGLPSGEWTFAIGPDYTSPNYIASEKLYFELDSGIVEPDFAMRRLRGSGVFFGHWESGGLRAYVWDFAPPDMAVTLRYVVLKDERGRDVRVCARVVPFEAESYEMDGGVRIVKDTSRYCFGNLETLNWAERTCEVYFAGNGSVRADGDGYVLGTSADSCMLVHSHGYGAAERPVLGEPGALLARTLEYWDGWLKAGHMPDIADQRAADAVESLLMSVKMQQNRDGGCIAGIRKYANSYIRDTHGAMRMLLATGHHAEVKKLIQNIHSRWQIAGFIPNWWSMGSDSFIGHSFHNDAAEVTAYYIFMVRDYLRATDDSDFVEEVMPSVKWAAQAQLDWLRAHDFTMDFNGDETEQYCCNNDGEEYGGFVQKGYEWDRTALSFPSMAAALCSLEWYAGYTGEDNSGDMQRLREQLDRVFLGADGIHSWHVQKTAEGFARHRGRLSNYLLLPMWVGAALENGGERADALAVKGFVRDDGFIPNCPEIMPGFCGHTMGLFLYDMLLLGERGAAEAAVRTILYSRLLSMYGTVSEFYGPSCTPNGHGCRPFEGGILGEALVKYFETK